MARLRPDTDTRGHRQFRIGLIARLSVAQRHQYAAEPQLHAGQAGPASVGDQADTRARHDEPVRRRVLLAVARSPRSRAARAARSGRNQDDPTYPANAPAPNATGYSAPPANSSPGSSTSASPPIPPPRRPSASRRSARPWASTPPPSMNRRAPLGSADASRRSGRGPWPGASCARSNEASGRAYASAPRFGAGRCSPNTPPRHHPRRPPSMEHPRSGGGA